MITKKVEDKEYVLVWVNKNCIFESGSIDTFNGFEDSDWYYASLGEKVK